MELNLGILSIGALVYIISLSVDHLGELPYECETCDMKFKKANQLKNHTSLIHLGQKFACILCSREYEDCESLGRHSRKYHNISMRKLKDMKQKN